MDQRVSIITLGVRDLTRAATFYSRLGWQGQEIDRTVFFQAGGLAVVLWGIDDLANDAGVAVAPPLTFGGIALAHNVASRVEVDAIIATAAAAGGEVTKAPAETFYGGYAGYFRDPDGHLWEVAHNPGFHLAEDGSLALPDFGV